MVQYRKVIGLMIKYMVLGELLTLMEQFGKGSGRMEKKLKELLPTEVVLCKRDLTLTRLMEDV